MVLTRLTIGLISLVAFMSCSDTTTDDAPHTAGTASPAQAPADVPPEIPADTKENSPASPPITLGNGDANWIVVEGASRDQATLTFSEVRIDGNGWLVMHPFKDGKPVGDIYVGHSYVEDGDNRNVEITVDPEPATGDMFIVMLHRDVNENREFDFVFVDEINVLDKAVFEGPVMIAHAIAAP
jgi:hypothetical protein